MPKTSALLSVVHNASPPPRKPNRRIGEILVERGLVGEDALEGALEVQRQSGRRLGEVLVAQSLVSPEHFQLALAEQWSVTRADPERDPPDPALLSTADPVACLRLGCMPWRSAGAATILLVSDPTRVDDAIVAAGLRRSNTSIALCPAEKIQSVLAEHFSEALSEHALNRTPEPFSCRNWSRVSQYWAMAVVLVAGLGLALWGFGALLVTLLIWISVANLATTCLRFGALASLVHERRSRRRARDIPAEALLQNTPRRLPVVSLLVPVYGECAVLDHLVAALSAINYPAAHLEVLLVMEADDHPMRRALKNMELPANFRVIAAPRADIRTKPRALNYALDFCTGDIVGIYDAEDQPEIDQIAKVARAFAESPPRVACVQARLGYYNARQNWLSRCFTIEYATWFNILLSGYRRLGLPIPLGGTSVFFRRAALEEIGAWDAHNVTEDADLGIRLARFGYCTRLIHSTTWEEANCLPRAWIKQRARWLKGYIITWITHMRRPHHLWRDLGARGFFGFQVLFLGGITAFLSLPLLWILWFLTAWGATSLAGGAVSPALIAVVGGTFVLGQIVFVATNIVALWRTRQIRLAPWVLTLPFYWPLGAVAAYKAVIDLVRAPFHWDKTRHGISPRYRRSDPSQTGGGALSANNESRPR